MIKSKFIPPDGPFGPLSPYLNTYLTQIREQGYAVGSTYEQIYVLKKFGCWLKRTGREVQDANEAAAAKFLGRSGGRGYGKNAGRSTLRRLSALLRQVGAMPAAIVPRPRPPEQMLCAYERYLYDERNLSRRTITWHRRYVSRFLSEQFGGSPLNVSELRAPDVTEFVRRQAQRVSPVEAKSLLAATRSFLRYLHYKGLINSDLSLAVPKVARWSFSTVPKHLSPTQVRQVLRHCDQGTALGRRDYAVLLLLARLGLRAGEVVRLNLEDIDWENGLITVCGKGKWAQLPLPADAARAIAQYLRRDRPQCNCRRVFIRDYAPIDGFGRAGSIASIVKRALTRAGVASARRGAHLLRHSLATDMLRKGASLDEIGEVLRHKSPDTTAIYAKVDLNALKTLALPWPGGVR